MKNFSLIFIILFMSCKAYKSDYSMLNLESKIYIYVDNKSNLKYHYYYKNAEMNETIYHFDLPNDVNLPYQNKKGFLKFIHRKYMDYDKFFNKEPSFTKKVDKSFIKKNKEKIVNYDFFKEKGLLKSHQILFEKKLFIIEKDSTSSKKYLIREVIMFSSIPLLE